MGKRPLTLLVATVIVLAGATGVKNGIRKWGDDRAKYDAAYSEIAKLADTDDRDGTSPSEMNTMYKIITGKCKRNESPELTYEQVHRYLINNGYRLENGSWGLGD